MYSNTENQAEDYFYDYYEMDDYKLIWVKDTLVTKIHRNLPGKYILITAPINSDFDITDVNTNDIIMYKQSPKTFICLGRVISVQNKIIAIEKMPNVAGIHSRAKMIEKISTL